MRRESVYGVLVRVRWFFIAGIFAGQKPSGHRRDGYSEAETECDKDYRNKQADNDVQVIPLSACLAHAAAYLAARPITDAVDTLGVSDPGMSPNIAITGRKTPLPGCPQ